MIKKSDFYARLVVEAHSLLEGESDFIANAANFSALVYHSLPDVNWAGFYLVKHNELVLGPFQGKPACIRIAIGKGVCGTAAAQNAALVVPNVHEFPGHIACDSASNAELVVPFIIDKELVGVFDIDSPTVGRFDDADAQGVKDLINVFISNQEKHARG